MSVSPWVETSKHFQFDIEHSIKSYIYHFCKMTRCHPIIFLICLFFLAAFLITAAGGAPASVVGLSARSLQEGDKFSLTAAMPSPPEERDSPTESSPKALPFIKNPQCQLHKEDGTTKSKMCGLRELDLPGGASGIRSWNPSICHQFHCKCVPTKDVYRMRRTVAENKTALNSHRFRVFECV